MARISVHWLLWAVTVGNAPALKRLSLMVQSRALSSVGNVTSSRSCRAESARHGSAGNKTTNDAVVVQAAIFHRRVQFVDTVSTQMRRENGFTRY